MVGKVSNSEIVGDRVATIGLRASSIAFNHRVNDSAYPVAVRAGLACIDAVGRLDVKSVALQARVGIATGLAVVGGLICEGWAQEQSVVGETPNLAALHYWPPPVVGALITTQRVLASGLP
jgi:class 3 adenylate cyclase